MVTQPVVLVAGAVGVGKSAVTSRLLAHPQQLAQQPEPQSQIHSWLIDTKYYTASVTLQEVTLPSSSSEAVTALVGVQGDTAEALVLVVDVQHEGSFDAARAWAEARPGVMEAAEVRLLLANKADLLHQQQTQQQQGHEEAGSQQEGTFQSEQRHRDEQQDMQRPAWLLSAMDWCTSSGVEYIEVCAVDNHLDAALVLDGEQQGILRVVHALQAHMWPGMQPKDRGSAIAMMPEHMQAEDQTSMAGKGTHQVKLTNSSSEADTTVAPTASGAVTNSSPGAGAKRAGQANGGSHSDNDDGADAQEAEQVEAFDKMFAEIQGAKQRLAGLPDDERRSQAAAIALKLASMLGLDSDSEEDENDDL